MADTLFGPTPEDLQALLQADRQAFLDRAATVSPAYSAGAGIGNLLGGVVSSVFGLENEKVKEARVMQDIQKKIRAENPGLTDKAAYYDIAASYLEEAGYADKALEAQNLANEYRISQEDRALNTEYKQAQIGNLKSEAEARLLPKPYEAKSSIGKLRADLAYAKANGDTDTVKAIEAEIAAETQSKLPKVEDKVDKIIYEGLVKQYGGDETKAANAFNRISVNQKKEIARAGAGESLVKALEVIKKQSEVQDKQTAIKTVDSKLYTENLAAQLNETYPEISNEADQAKMLTDFKNAKKHAIRSGYSEDDAEAYANERISKGIVETPGRFYGTDKSYKTSPLSKIQGTPAAETPTKAKSELPAGARAGQKVMSGPNAGKYEVLDTSGKLIGYADQGTK
jgi:hypothetical protein